MKGKNNITNKLKYNICVCGGGNISHAISGTMAYNDHIVNILTRKPEKWNKKINVKTPKSNYVGILNKISNDPIDVIPDCDIIIISVPVFAIEHIFNKIKPYLTNKMTIIGIPGRLYSEYNKDLYNINQIYILRTPYISRIDKYGSDVSITGYCYKELNYWSNNFNISEEILKTLFSFKLKKLKNLMSINLVNSNTILHPSRLYTLFKCKKEYTFKPLFYADWCLESSTNLINCDKELAKLINEINKDINVKNSIYVKPILEHYECNTETELTNKIKSCKGFTKPTPMIEKDGIFQCDYKNRYITEDVFIGMKYIINLAELYNVDIPKIKEIYDFFYKFK